jgi:hypothetical protein
LRWAEAQNRLGDALRNLAERKRDASMLCEALQSHFDAWQVYAGAAPYYASLAETGMTKDMLLLKKQFTPSASQGCPEYAQIQKQVNLH